MIPWRSSGDILRWWRSDVLGLTQQEAAERLNVRPSAVSNWERDTRTISIDLAELDEGLKGEHVLEGLLWACKTPVGLEPGRLWTKVFPGDSRPVWMWLRSDADHIAVLGEWGVAKLATEVEPGPNGVFITVGASIADSPVVVRFSKPGWADFGYGELPSEVPGAPIISAVSLFEKSSADGPFMDMFSSSIAAKLSAGSQDVLDLAQAAPGAVFSYVRDRDGRTADRSGPVDSETAGEGITAIERERFAGLRRARGLSLSALSERLHVKAGMDIGRDTLRRFETDVGQPHDPFLPVALDHALGAGGRLALLALQAAHGSGATRFPTYWRGPIWIRLDDERGSGQVLLRRGNWQRELSFEGPTLVSAHWFDPTVPLRVTAEPTTEWASGVGRPAGAEAIDQNWVPTSVGVAQQALAETEQAIFTALDRRPET